MKRSSIVLSAILACSLALGACSRSTPEAGQSDASEASQSDATSYDTIGEALRDADGTETVIKALKDTGLDGIFDKQGSYTLFAPTDDAFKTLGDPGKALLDNEEDRAALAALLKDHIATGYVTLDDLDAAITGSGSAKLATVGDGTITVTKDGNTFVVTGPDGSRAKVAGAEMTGGQSAAIPVDAVLKKM